MSFRSQKSLKINTITKHRVLWLILKVTKKHDQGMENVFFVLRFQICICGVALKFKGVFCVFYFLRFLVIVSKFAFLDLALGSIFGF